jgi:type III secretion protein U
VSEKTEQPTSQKLREARKKGQIPKSRMLSSSAVTLGGLMGFLAFAPESAARLRGWTASLFSRQELDLHAVALEALTVFARLAAPALMGSLVASIIASVAMAGFQLQPELVVPKLERIDPMAGFKRLFSTRQLVEIAKGLAIVAIVVVLVWKMASGSAAGVFRAVSLRGTGALEFVLQQLIPLLKRCAAVVLVLGAGDWFLARRRHIKDLMMSREDLKQEHKNSEGDPHHKAKRKAVHKQLAMGGGARGVQKASVVVVNPTHIAVALRYDESECDAPYIVARGREEDALKIRRDAKRHGVPVVKDIPLARSLVHYDVGEEVPDELYKAAAAVLKVALETKDKDGGPKGGTP